MSDNTKGKLKIANYIIVGTVLITTIKSIYEYIHYTNNVEMYLFNSAPWYTNILINLIIAVMVVSIAMIIKVILKKKLKGK